MVKASSSRAKDPGFDSRFRQGFLFPGRVIPVTLELALARQAPGNKGSALGLVGSVPVDCDFYLSVAARAIV